MQFKNSVDIPKFKVFLEELRERYWADDICLYFDNLAVHRSNVVKERMNELSFAWIFSPAYSPDLNPIESCFSIAKAIIKRRRLHAIVNGIHLDIHAAIREAFDQLGSVEICRCIRHSDALLQGHRREDV